jgi:hypothetical protein
MKYPLQVSWLSQDGAGASRHLHRATTASTLAAPAAGATAATAAAATAEATVKATQALKLLHLGDLQ